MKKDTIGRWILIATILASAMAFIDGSVVNVALPILQISFHATSSQIQWVVEIYSLLLSSLIILGGALGDMYGRKKVFFIGILIFTTASFLCGISPSLLLLTIFRAIQGIGAALLVPGSLSIITTYFSGAERGKAIGTWSAFSAITTALGPVVGGQLIQHFSWRMAFFVNVPLGILALVIVSLFIPESKEEHPPTKLDYLGALLITLSLGLLIYTLLAVSGIAMYGYILISVILFIAFIIREKRTPQPMMDLSLFTSKTFTGANLLTFLLYGALGGALYFLPFNLIQIQGYSPAAAGAIFIPFTILLFSLSRWAGTLITKIGAKESLIIGPVITGIGFILFAIPYIGGSYWTTFFPAIIVLGLGMAITVTPLTTTVMNAADRDESGLASGINNAISRAAGLIAIAILGLILFASFSMHLNSSLQMQSINTTTKMNIENQEAKLATISIPTNISTKTQIILKHDIQDAFIQSFRLVMLIGGLMGFSSALFSWLLIEGKPKKQL